ncbi:hypothetical protein ARMGADRAFT_1040063 [Armillaria gallica]|uniref:Uncharacterized protein n=1 Tax=Armillaria gallica TaxID=47427 RepID=A0A2H3CWF0_ARMGA|nr:hypothetical protein ARMGADRAFT_1040063 [Armillaria gallica]
MSCSSHMMSGKTVVVGRNFGSGTDLAGGTRTDQGVNIKMTKCDGPLPRDAARDLEIWRSGSAPHYDRLGWDSRREEESKEGRSPWPLMAEEASGRKKQRKEEARQDREKERRSHIILYSRSGLLRLTSMAGASLELVKSLPSASTLDVIEQVKCRTPAFEDWQISTYVLKLNRRLLWRRRAKYWNL